MEPNQKKQQKEEHMIYSPEAYGPGYHSSLVVLAKTDKNSGDIKQKSNVVTEKN